MKTQDSNHLTVQLQKLEQEGYTDHLMFEFGKLTNLTNKKMYSEKQIVKSDEYRFEGMTNPDDMSILFAIEFDDGEKGTLAAPFGSQGDANLFEFMNRVKK